MVQLVQTSAHYGLCTLPLIRDSLFIGSEGLRQSCKALFKITGFKQSEQDF